MDKANYILEGKNVAIGYRKGKYPLKVSEHLDFQRISAS